MRTVAGECIGVLALQGDFEDHEKALRALGAQVRRVRRTADLDGLDGLVLPGGESSVMHRLLEESDLGSRLDAAIRAGLPVMGTCAGAILLGHTPLGPEGRGHLDCDLKRNDYGRQAESFTRDLSCPSLGPEPLTAVFIRAPRILRTGPGIEVLAREGSDPVLVHQAADPTGRPELMVATFHPELTGDRRVHQLFMETMVRHRVPA